jgi:4-hydroxy-3-methylbut-2-enyl diphosphate reductase
MQNKCWSKSHLKNKDFIVEYSAMKISIAKNSGFCFGVKRAIQIAKETADKRKNVYIKGDLVHNEIVCEEIKEKGIARVDSLSSVPNGAVLIIKAHGEPLETHLIAQKKNIEIIDATCPMVKDIHEKAKDLENKGYQIIVVGEKNHQETIGILGNIQKGLVLENVKDIAKIKTKLKKKIAIVCQSTQTISNITQVAAALLKYTEEMLFNNTVCQPTRLRQKEIQKLASRCQAVLIVGSKKSANTRRLHQEAKKINKNAFWITSDIINKNKLKKFKSVGIIGGASTPPQVLESIANKLK